MKSKTNKAKLPMPDKSPERLARLKALSERIHGKFKNFMTQEDLRRMREDHKWEANEKAP